jgi:hypothetical protein
MTEPGATLFKRVAPEALGGALRQSRADADIDAAKSVAARSREPCVRGWEAGARFFRRESTIWRRRSPRFRCSTITSP